MRTFAQKPKASQQSNSAKAQVPGRLSHGQRDVARVPLFSLLPLEVWPKLKVSAPGDEYEKEADRVADRVMRMPEQSMGGGLDSILAHPGTAPECVCNGFEEKLNRKPADETIHRQEDEELQLKRCDDVVQRQQHEEEGYIQNKEAPGVGPALIATSESAISGLRGGGAFLPNTERAFFEPRFGRDFSDVRIHTDETAEAASHSINARAFTLGNDIAFARGEYAPGTDGGRRLMAHELAHVTGEDRAPGQTIRRKTPAAGTADPLCDKYDSFIDKFILEADVNKMAAGGDAEARLSVIQSLKIFHRCYGEAEITEVKTLMTDKLGEEESDALWKEAGKAFGGYRGVFPGYYSGRGRLKNLGATEVEGFEKFNYPEPSIDPAIFDPRAEASATSMAGTIENTDILYFYGHQYAQYGNPGAFANKTQDKFVDLRKLAGKGDFGRVKLIISTSCATICKEALEVFVPLFPNAIILGYRKSAPKKGKSVRNSFDKRIRGFKKPLLLNEPVDVSAIIGVWKSVIESHHPNESTRLPGYYQGGTTHYLKHGKWDSIGGTEAANSCKKKGTQIQQAR